MHKKFINRLFSVIASISLLFNSLSAPLMVYAQEATPTASPEQVEETTEPTPEPTVEATPIPTEEPTPEPTVEASPTPETETETGTVEAIAVEATSENQPEESIESVLPESDLEEPQENSSATLAPSISTDKVDYAPSETVVINGNDFPVNSELTIRVTWPDGVIRNSTGVEDETDSVLTDDNGSFVFLYDLRGEGQEGEYLVEILLGGALLATTIFTDALPVSPINCVSDTAGADDEPGQKDLTRMCFDPTNEPVSTYSEWNWDETGWPGGNTGDACSLFDTDNNGLVDFATCVTVSGTPATQVSNSPRIYLCNDTRSDRCAGNSLVSGPYTTTCEVEQSSTQPFPTGADTPNDTRAGCTTQLSEVGGTSAKLIDVCSFPSEQPNSDPSDCIIFQKRSGKLEVKKVLDPSNDSGLFNLYIGDTTYAFDVGNGGFTGEVILDTGTYEVGETAGTGTNLGSYNSSIECRDLNGIGVVVAQSSDAGPLPVEVGVEDDIVCTITNTLQSGELHVIKRVINDNGGALEANDFSFSVNGDIAINFEVDGQNDLTVNPGTYTVIEPAVTGYSTTYDNCTDVVVPAGGSATCTITNDDIQPLLTVTKIVANNSGGDLEVSDFPLFVDGTQVTSGVPNGFSVGNYVVREDEQDGYSATFGGDCDENGNVSLALGDIKSCTITNEDIAPTLTLIKTVVNNNGGTKLVSDFPLFINAVEVVSDIANTLVANVLYTASETEYPGYAPSTWGGDCGPDGTITLLPGDDKTCTITNDDIAPTLTLIKDVINDDGGNNIVSDFLLFIGDLPVISEIPEILDAGGYTVREQTIDGYAPSAWAGDCGPGGLITLLPGDDKICTIINDDVAPTITLIKDVINDNGGTARENDFGLTVGGVPVDSGETVSVLANTQIALDEVGFFGYGFVSITGDEKCPDTLGETVTLDEGENITCTITNDDIAPTLTLIKHVVNDDGGTSQVDDFNLYIDGNPATSGVSYDVEANLVHTASEDLVSGYTPSDWYGDCDKNGTVTLLPGENKICEIDNDDIAPTLTLHKEVITDDGGTATANDFQAYIDGNSVPWGQAQTLPVGSYQASEDVVPGYSPSSWSGDCDAQGNVILTEGDNLDCYITNDDIAPILTLIKYLPNDDGGTAVEGDFTAYIDGNSVPWGVPQTLLAGGHTASETTLTGYAASAWGGDCAADGSVSLAEGGNKTCEITNDDIAPKLTLIKSNDKSGGASGGDEVNYTLEVTNTGDWDVLVDVTDVLPGGFTYVTNSAKIDGIFQEPNLSSPGKLIWENVFVSTDNLVTITYQATISSDINQGIYTNLATCKGIVGRVFSENDREGKFGTVDCNIADSSVPIGIDFTYSDSLRGEVLGVATELPATGNDTKILIMLLTMLALGVSFKVVSYNMAEKKEEKNV